MNELLTCPFCGGDPVVHPGRSFPDMQYVSCHMNHCHANPSVWAYTANEAIARWNKRAAQIPIDDIEYIIARYTFHVERGQSEQLDRVNAWLDKVKPLEEVSA